MNLDGETTLLRLTASREAKELNTFDDFQIAELEKNMDTQTAESEIIRFAQFLLDDYSFDRLVLSDGEMRRRFAFGMAQCWLFKRLIPDTTNGVLNFRSCFISPLAAIIGVDYKLILDEVEIIEKLTKKKVADLVAPKPSKFPVDYDNKFFKWPFLNQVAGISLPELKAILLIANAVSTQTGLLELSRVSGDKTLQREISELSRKGFVKLEVPRGDLLALFPLQMLKTFVAEQEFENIPSKKSDVIDFIKQNCEEASVERFVNFLIHDPYYGYAKDHFVRPVIPNIKPLQEYVRSEIHRLSLYLEHIACIEHRFPTLVSPLLKQKDRPGDFMREGKPRTGRNRKRAFDPQDFVKNLRPSDIKVIQKYWDVDCDRILEKAKNDVPGKFPASNALYEITRFWDRTGVLPLYQSEMPSSSRYWYEALGNYISYKLSSDESYQLTPTKKTCKGCGRVFLEWSISIHIIAKVGKNIEFCNSCYSYIFGHPFTANTREVTLLPEETILGYLYQLSHLLGFIPTQTYMENIELPTQQADKQIEIGRLLLKMPAYAIYIEKFGHWLKCLTLAGVLDDGHRKTSRGIQCFANDGHLCLSLGEKAIDDWLTKHDIPHEKEAFYPYDDKLNPNRLSRVDWKIGNIFIEFAGLMDDNEYAQKMKKKIQLAKKSGLDLTIIEPRDLLDLDGKLLHIKLQDTKAAEHPAEADGGDSPRPRDSAD